MSTAFANAFAGKAKVDPMKTAFDALVAAEAVPHELGPGNVRAKCPAHAGISDGSLHVSEGTDGRVVLHCFGGCRPEEVVRALGIAWRDLFPLGTHRHNVRRARPRPRTRGRLEIMLEGCELVGISVKGKWILSHCPFCSCQGAWLYCNEAGLLDVHCANECARVDVFASLETAVAIAEASHGAG